MKKMKLWFVVFLSVLGLEGMAQGAAAKAYCPTEDNLKAREDFSDSKFGIFLHWGIYSMFGQGEWYLNHGNLRCDEYAKAASGFYPAKFDADAWVKAFKDAGAKYVCFTSRHHDGFSMFDTKYSDYDIVDATPYKRDVLRELADACKRHGLKLHLYYSHLDWTREDYPAGWSGLNTGRDKSKVDWDSYRRFMNNQLEELVRNYDPQAVWFDGMWDHDGDLDWHLDEQYALIHKVKPSCLIGNNHHKLSLEGEDFQILSATFRERTRPVFLLVRK